MEKNEFQDRLQQRPYAVIVPDGTGSKGDEALISGCLSLLQGQKVRLLTPNSNLWCDALLGQTHLFEECTVPLEQMPEAVRASEVLLVIGADTLDGSCGYEEAHWRLEAIQAAAKNGSRVAVFCSVRSDMEERLVQEWKAIPESVSVFLRDSVSEKNFADLVGRSARHFSDLAFFAPSLQTERGKEFRNKVKSLKEQKRVIGLEISETMFRSFNTELTDDKRREFAETVASLAVQGMSPDNVAILLLTHDTRLWDSCWSDNQYACVAQKEFEKNGFSCLAQPPELTQAELLTLGKFCDLLICGRMHMSITACRNGVVPLIVAGTGKNYTMVDKVRGMCREWMGSDQNLLLSLEEIPRVRDQLLAENTLQETLDRKGENLQSVLSSEREMFADLFEVKQVQWDESAVKENALIQAMQRSAELNRALNAEKIHGKNKEAHIQILLQRERDLQSDLSCWEEKCQNLDCKWREKEEECKQLRGKVATLKEKYKKLENEVACRERECQQLRDKENQLKNALEATRNSRSWRIGRIFAKPIRFLVPVGSKRALFCRLLWTAVRHPVKFCKNLSVRKIKKFFRLLGRGRAEDLNVIVQNSINGGPIPSIIEVEKPDIVAVDITKEWKISDFPVLEIPQWENPQVSIIIPVYNQFAYTYYCVQSILKNSGDITYEIIVANDCSTDLTTQIETILPGVICVTNEQNLRFLRNCNNAAKHAKGQYVLFLNNDTQVQANWLEPLVQLIESDEKIGMVGSKLIYPDGLLQEAGGILWKDGAAWNYGNRKNPQMPEFNYVKQVDYISGAAIMLSRALWEEIGGFDEYFVPAYNEDSDLAFTVRKLGYKVMYQPKSVVVHFEGVSNGTDTSSGQKKYQVENKQKFYRKWKEELKKHPENGENVFQARDYSYSRKTLLMVDHYVPTFDKDAGSRTVFQYLKLFVNQGFNVKFIGDNFYQSEPYTTVLQQMGIEVLYGPYYAQHWKDWVIENADKFDYVFLNRPHIAPKYLDFLREHTKARIVYYGHDLAFLREMREFEVTGDESFRDSSKEWREKELELMRKADMAYYPSYVEEEEIHRIDPEIRVKAIPAYLFEQVKWNGYDFAKRKDIMFIGGFSHRPNVDAVKWIAGEILPELLKFLPEIRIHILGSNPPAEVKALANEHLLIRGFVSDEELAQFYSNCRISLVALRYGAGIKGKVIEAMKFGTPVVTTSSGAEGIVNAEDVMVVEDDAKVLAERLAALYENENELEKMSRDSVAYIQREFSPANAIKVIGSEFDL